MVHSLVGTKALSSLWVLSKVSSEKTVWFVKLYTSGHVFKPAAVPW